MKFSAIIIIIVSFLSCTNRKNDQVYTPRHIFFIPQLAVIDTSYQKKIEDIIFDSPCFNKDRKFIEMIFDSTTLFVSQSKLVGYEETIKDIYGGFYPIENDSSYVFIVRNTGKNIPPNVYEKINGGIDIKDYIGNEMASDVDWLMERNGKELKLSRFLCP
ncbi:hypothetical protein [Proteiniphilum sp.]|uniref:hypothetical protein n=1 Tax=Proteiniphilum sp. TaxID=1926877 RepID=UPI002B210416|nr:hypothetical protein [Proteiniphilum sp.]MEA4919209.1 hypothetical protein [Proteiniphilum sp.]